MTAISKNIYFDVLDDIVNKYNNTVHRTIKMKPIEVAGDFYVKCNKDSMKLHSMKLNSIELHSNKKDPKFKVGDHVRISKYKSIFNKKDPKFKVGDHVRISKYKSIFAKGYTPNWSEEVFVINKIENAVPWTYLEVFMKKNFKGIEKKNLE